MPRASLAEPAQSSMKAANESSISLADSVYADLVDGARLKAEWRNRLAGDSSNGSGPSAVRRVDCDEARQINRAIAFSREVEGGIELEKSEEEISVELWMSKGPIVKINQLLSEKCNYRQLRSVNPGFPR